MKEKTFWVPQGACSSPYIQQTPVIKLSLIILDQDISMIERTKHLGVRVHQYLSWDVQIAEIMKWYQGH